LGNITSNTVTGSVMLHLSQNIQDMKHP